MNNKSEWNVFMDKLVEMGLSVKNGEHYITRSKLKSWKKWCSEKMPFVLDLNGYIIYELSFLYKNKNNSNLRDLIYLSLIENVGRGKSLSRSFIKKFTGLSDQKQRKLENKYKGSLIETEEYHVPLNDKEQKETDKPIFNGVISPKEMKCMKTNKKKSNCKVIQLGNKTKIKKINLSSFLSKKSKRSNDSAEAPEVLDWENFDMVIDCSTEASSSKFRGILSTKDTRKISWKDFSHYDYENVKVFDEEGNLTSIRTIMSK